MALSGDVKGQTRGTDGRIRPWFVGKKSRLNMYIAIAACDLWRMVGR